MNRIFVTLAAIGLSCLLTACGTSYSGSNAGGMFGGVHVDRLSDTEWQIRSATNGYSRRDQGQDMALYKAAVIARATNYRYIQIYAFTIFVTRGEGKETATMRMRTTNNPRPPYRCESAEFRQNCRTLSVDDTIAYYGPRIPQTPAETEAEVAKLRTLYGSPEAAVLPTVPPVPAAPRKNKAGN